MNIIMKNFRFTAYEGYQVDLDKILAIFKKMQLDNPPTPVITKKTTFDAIAKELLSRENSATVQPSGGTVTGEPSGDSTSLIEKKVESTESSQSSQSLDLQISMVKYTYCNKMMYINFQTPTESKADKEITVSISGSGKVNIQGGLADPAYTDKIYNMLLKNVFWNPDIYYKLPINYLHRRTRIRRKVELKWPKFRYNATLNKPLQKYLDTVDKLCGPTPIIEWGGL